MTSPSTTPSTSEETTILGDGKREIPASILAMREALAKYDEGMALIGGCGDGNCLVERRRGQHTNGGCRCYSDRMTAHRAMSRGKWLAEEIRKAVA